MGHPPPFSALVRLAAAAALAAGLSPSFGGAAVINVGPGGAAAGCEAASFSEALSLAASTSAADEIHLLGNVTYELDEALHFTDWNYSNHGALTLAGGYADCADISPTEPRTGIHYWGIAPTLEVDTTGSGGSFLTLRRIELLYDTVRPLVVQGNGVVNLHNSIIAFNEAGGVSVESGATLNVDGFSWIQGNGIDASEGGGIRCVGAGSAVVLDGTVYDNEASNWGGGVYAADGCVVYLGSHARITGNRALLGGGIAARLAAEVRSLGRVEIDHNVASSSGGGLFAEGVLTYVELGGVEILSNRAGFAGAGIHVGASARVVLDGSACPGTVACPSVLRDNQLEPGARNGSAGLAVNNGKLFLWQTEVIHNIVPEAEPHGSVLYAAGAGAEVRTESAVILANRGANRVFLAEAGGSVDAAYTTTAFNQYEVDGIGREAVGMRLAGTDSMGEIHASIFYPTAGYEVVSGGSFAEVECLITESMTGVPADATTVYVLNPRYANTAVDMSLRPDSPAIDFCDNTAYEGTQPDIYGRPRGFDSASNPNGSPGITNGIQDAGAYEFRDLFADGFESGRSTRWSSDLP